MDSSSIQLLNNRVYNEGMSSESPPLSQAHEATNKMKKAKCRSKNLTIQQYMLLISAWEDVSLDPIQGDNQT
ncbi:hypothetical protein DCAR_0414964 [Daucus carota subsp. sativus]|uniref:Uncharacterized protein n=1 Tax=Daucus carota subsp. sativus TaxID=79200 RepID=A0A165A498_DAUCS|nr:hypothetical protein DCAR_0414964 [Daucus carota subsp. sativus]